MRIEWTIVNQRGAVVERGSRRTSVDMGSVTQKITLGLGVGLENTGRLCFRRRLVEGKGPLNAR